MNPKLLEVVSFARVLLQVLPEAKGAVEEALAKWASLNGVEVEELVDVGPLVAAVDAEVDRALGTLPQDPGK